MLATRLVTARLGVQQVHGNRRRRGASLPEDPSRVSVQPCPLSRRQPAQHGLSHQRVLELDGTSVAKNARPHEPLAERRRLARVHAG